MRVSSPILPSWMGTLKSTRISTRLPRRSTSDILSKRIGPRVEGLGLRERRRTPGWVPSVLDPAFLARVHQRNRDVQHPVAEPPFVVVPPPDFHHLPPQHPDHATIEAPARSL